MTLWYEAVMDGLGTSSSSIRAAAAKAASQSLSPDVGRAKLLLVDDNPNNLVSLAATLETLDQEIVLAHSGMDALRHMLESDFAAILLDVKMPDMDGLETAEIIRSRKRSKDTPIIFLTGFRNDEHLFRGYDLGAVDFLYKPIIPEILRSKVMVFVRLWRAIEIQKAQADALRKTEQRFRSLLEAAPDAIVISLENGEIVLVNSRTESLFGFKRENLIGRNVRMLVPDWTWRAPDSREDAPREGNKAADLRARRQDSAEFPAAITTSPLQTSEGILITSAIRDISDRKRAEERIREINTELEARVAERTADLQRTNEQLTQFAYAASHDLQEPLRMVVSFTQLLEERYKSRLDADADRLIGFAVEGALRMEVLLKGLREYLQADDARPAGAVDCNLAFQKACQNLESAITASGAEVTCDALPKVPAPEVSIVQVFQNLIGNAIKYRSLQPPRVHVSASEESDENTSGGVWRFSVRDNGIGIEPQHVNRIFGIFKRLHGPQYAGAGIGLALCHRIVDRLGGRIWVESELGHGSTFFFTLPRR